MKVALKKLVKLAGLPSYKMCFYGMVCKCKIDGRQSLCVRFHYYQTSSVQCLSNFFFVFIPGCLCYFLPL